VLAGRYRLEGRVRTGPGGSLWRAVDETLDRPVLVQAFVLGHPYGPEIVDAARRAALVEDPRLQRVLAAGEERGTAYVVLERLSGRTLVDLLGSGPLPAETARRVVGEAAQALDRAAARGLHHLRLRPTSLVVAPDGAVTVVGTAIDAAADGVESPNTPVSTRSDAVGLVALLYAALTGRWPGAQDAGLARAPRVAGRPVPPGDLVAGVPNDLDTLCAVALGPHEDGPRTPGELAAQLSPWAPAAPLTDSRGLHLGAPARPMQDGDPTLLPVEAQPAEPPARRTPAWGRRVNRRSRLGAETSPQPVVPPAPPVPAAVTEPAAGRSEAPEPGGEPGPGGGNAGPAWATVEELRRALRRTGSAVPPSGTPPGPAPGAGLPLAASAPPAGAPLSAAAAPVGAPLADAVPPAGPPTATPAPAAGSEPLSTATAVTPAPAAGAAGGRTDAGAGAGALGAPHDEPLEPLDEPHDVSQAVPPASAVLDPAATVVMPAADPAAAEPAAASAEPGAGPVRAAPVRTAPAPPRAAHASVPAAPVQAGRAHAGPAHTPTQAGPTQATMPADRVPMEPWYGNGHAHAGGYRPDSGGVHGLEMFAADAQPADPLEAVAPFGPEVPLTRPPREQSRLVLLILAVLLVVAGVVAFRQLMSFHPAALITAGGGAPATPPGEKPAPSASAAPSTSTTAGRSPSASPVAIAGVQAIDPQGDDSENNELAARAIDDNRDTAWRSEGYESPQFGGIKKGLGLAVDLGDPAAVSAVTLTAPGSDGIVELRSADSPDYDGSKTVARNRLGGSGRVVLAPEKPVSSRYLLVWFTRAPLQGNGDRRVIVDEIDVR
jgi:hypothetical protein